MRQETLHAIMFSVLKEKGEPMYPRDLAEVIRKGGLYTQRDGTPLKDGQISARVNNNPDLFIRINRKVTINDGVIPETEKSPSSTKNIEASKANPTNVSKVGVQGVMEAKGGCEAIEDKQDDLKMAEEIIERAYELLIRKLGAGGLSVRNEMAFQIELGSILRILGNMYEFSPEDKFSLHFESYINLKEKSNKSGKNRARVDILIYYKSIRAAIELKFFKKENHREPNNRYDVFNDLSNLENYKESDIDLCYFMLGTDHTHYVDPKIGYSQDTGDFDFRDKVKYEDNKLLEYKTDKPYGSPIRLKQDYSFNWDIINKLNFLKVKV